MSANQRDPYRAPASAMREEVVSHVGSIRRFEEAMIDHMKGSRVWIVLGMILGVSTAAGALAGAISAALPGVFAGGRGPSGAGAAVFFLAVGAMSGWSMILMVRYWKAISRLAATSAREDLAGALGARRWARIGTGVLFTGIGAALWAVSL